MLGDLLGCDSHHPVEIFVSLTGDSQKLKQAVGSELHFTGTTYRFGNSHLNDCRACSDSA
jgi:hypothetical protein